MNNIKLVLSDFDGTLTFKEELGAIFFEILDLLKTKQIPLVIVTGRSLSWGHFLLTHFPFLTEVIVEGGGVIVKRSGKIISEELVVAESEVQRLAEFCQVLRSEIPQLSLSVDSFGRKTDRAIELYDLKDEVLKDRVIKLLNDHQINYSTSNVHLNFWCGEISKFKAVTKFLASKKVNAENCVFFGDSLNDESMFKSFANTVGVSNISSILNKLTHKPKVVLAGGENMGPYGVLNFLKKIL